VDHTGSEESKQPAGNRGASSEDSADEQRAAGERPEQEDEPESARRAFDLLERFSGELEVILEALERTRGSGTPTEKSPPPPERAFRPASIHFESSPISTRIDPNALPPVESPGATTRPAPRLLLEGLFLVLVAAISARTGQRPLLIVAAEAVAFVIVLSIELALAREKRRVQRLPAAPPLLTAPEERTTVTGPGVTSVTLDQVEPLVWTDRQEYAEPDWPLGAFELPREAEDTGEAQEGATEISDAVRPEAERVAAREPAPEAPAETDPESAAPTSIVVPERAAEAEAAPEVEPEIDSESSAEEAEPAPARLRRFHFHREAKAPEVEPEVEAENEPEIEAEGSAEAEEAEPAPARPRRFHFHREAKAPEPDLEPETGPEPAPELEHEVEAESLAAIEGEDEEPAETSRFHPFRQDAQAPELEVEAEAEPAIENENEKKEPAQPRRLHLFRHEAKAPKAELEPGPEPEPAAEAEPAPEVEPESPPSLAAEVGEPARTSRFHPFRHEAKAPEPEPANEIELPPVTEIEAESSPEAAAEEELENEAKSSLEAVAEEGERERPRRFHLPHRETQAPEAGAELEAEPELEAEDPPEIALEDEAPERPRRFHLLHRETGKPEEEPEVKLESTLEIPASEVVPERYGRSRLFARDETLEAEAESPPEAIVEESEPEVFAAEAEPEPPRRFHLFRHEERWLDAEMEHEVAAEPEDELRPDMESPPEDAAEASEPGPPRRFHLFRHEADAEAPRNRDDALANVPWPSLPAEPADATGGGEMTVEIELPPEIAVGEIEHTLEDLGRRTPGLRRRRRRHAGAVREVAQPAIEDETAGEDGELRFAAEQERRRREREYLRKLRASR
jgi:hypothetical protein